MEFQRKGQERLGRADISWGGSNPADTIPSFVFCHTSIFALASCTDPLMRVPLPSFWCLIRHSPPLNNQHYTVSFQVLPHHLCHLPPFLQQCTLYSIRVYLHFLAVRKKEEEYFIICTWLRYFLCQVEKWLSFILQYMWWTNKSQHNVSYNLYSPIEHNYKLSL